MKETTVHQQGIVGSKRSSICSAKGCVAAKIYHGNNLP